MIEVFQKLGWSLADRWRRIGQDEERFSRLAVEALSEARVHERADVEDIFDWAFSDRMDVVQPPGFGFGQPPILLFNVQEFCIEALFWLDGSTAIHEHGFSGAFTPLRGSSVHNVWAFDEEQRLNSGMYLGSLRRRKTEILKSGDVRPIEAGDRMIHQLFHLEQPSVTIVVRTHREVDKQPQRSFFPSGLALSPFKQDGLYERRQAFINVMLRSDLGDAVARSEQLLRSGDPETAFRLLSFLSRQDLGSKNLTYFSEIGREVLGDLVDRFIDAIEGENRLIRITGFRAKARQPEHRFLLALLMLIDDRHAIFEIVSSQYPDSEPVSLVLTWIEEISKLTDLGMDFDEVNRLIFECLLRGQDRKEIIEEFKQRYGSAEVSRQEEDLQEQIRSIKTSEMFKPLLKAS